MSIGIGALYHPRMRKGEEEGNLPIDSDRGVQALRAVIQANGERL